MIDWRTVGSDVRLALNIAATISFIVYIPALFLEQRRAHRSDQKEREKETAERTRAVYDQLVESYMDWQKLCLEYIDLDIADTPDPSSAPPLSPARKKQEQIAFSLLLAIFERVYLAFLDAPEELKKLQWGGWERYMDEYCARPNFRAAWIPGTTNLDLRFEAFMNAKIQQAAANQSIVRPAQVRS